MNLKSKEYKEWGEWRKGGIASTHRCVSTAVFQKEVVIKPL